MLDQDLVAVDTETTGLDLRHDCRPFIVVTCDLEGNSRCWEWPVDPTTRQPQIPKEDIAEINNYLAFKTLIFHNAKFDLRALETIGIYLFFQKRDWYSRKAINATACIDFHDTLLMSHALSSSDKHGLKELGVKYLRYSSSDEKNLKKEVTRCTTKAKHIYPEIALGYSPQGRRKTGYDYWIPRLVEPDNDCCSTYAIKDVERTALLFNLFNQLLDEEEVRYGYEREMDLLQVVYQMENQGITVHKQKLKEKIRTLETKECTLKKKCRRAMKSKLPANYNPDSTKDLPLYLYSKEGLSLKPPRVTDKGNPSTDKETLIELASDESLPTQTRRFLLNLVESRVHSSGKKYLCNYLSFGISSPENSNYLTLYPSLNQSGTKTTRFSCSNPNGQNVSAITVVELGDKEIEGPKLREVFCPPPDRTWYAIDYSQLELRVFAACSREQSLIDALDAGYDFHGFVAQKIFDKPADKVTKQERRIAKNVNFALIFGAGPNKVNATAGIPNAYELFSEQFPNVKSYMDKTIRYAKKHNHVFTLDGYRIDTSPQAPYKAVNYIVQGTAGSIIKNAMIVIHQQNLVDWIYSRLVLQIHDELLIEISNNKPHKKTISRIITAMENAGGELGINTPVSVDIIESNWGQGKELPRTYFFKKVKHGTT